MPLRSAAHIAAACALGLLVSVAAPLPVRAAPPAGALPLSQILQTLEAQGDVAWFKEVEWDDDGHWEIEYRRKDGGNVEIRVDPISGARR